MMRWAYLVLTAMPCAILLGQWLTGASITWGLVAAIFSLPLGVASGLALVDLLNWRDTRRVAGRRGWTGSEAS